MKIPFAHTSEYLAYLQSPAFDFDETAQALWEYQLSHNETMQSFAQQFGQSDTPLFMPISFFKSFEMKTGNWQPAAIFESSKTTGQTPSRHFVKELDTYKQLSLSAFFQFFPKKQYKILALLPSYLERENASLVQMVKFWMETFGTAGSGFYLHNFDELAQAIYESEGEDILLIGVAFALLDFADYFKGKLPVNSLVMETGGMKGRKKELTRTQMHTQLTAALGVPTIASEYGMTELLSQAYAVQNGRFFTPPWLKVMISDIHLPTLPQKIGITGRINLIDLANVHSCAFISTDDAGRMHPDGSFEVMGRIDHAEMRGCNLMYVSG